MLVPDNFGVIADLQCGGWSTSILNDRGVLMTAGILNGMSHPWVSQSLLKPMLYPPGFPQPIERYDPSVALREFSSGRTHILGLSDTGIIWAWSNTENPAVQLKFHNLPLSYGASSSATEAEGGVVSIVAGWDKSSAYIRGTGIVIWDIVQGPPSEEQDLDTVLVEHWVAIPKTDYQRPRGRSQREPDESTRLLGQEVGQVTNYIVLERFVVFVTDNYKVFAAKTTSGIVEDMFQLLDLQAVSETDDSPAAMDVQGSFRSFAIFKRDGSVITSDTEYLEACSQHALGNHPDPLPTATKIPALQNSGVTSIAFGDYHFHALHSDGSISSYGVEPGGCGALGLGGGMGVPVPAGMLRGIKYNPWNQDGALLPHAYFRGRRIWFHPESEKWIRSLAQGGKNHDESVERIRMCGSIPPVQGEISEWVEQMGGNWDKRPIVAQKDDDGLGTYFALGVAAAGWHSGALILVNEDLVHAVTESCEVHAPSQAVDQAESSSAKVENSLQGQTERHVNEEQPSTRTIFRALRDLVASSFSLLAMPDTTEPTATIDFPRLRLDHGVEMPGEIPFSEWKEEKPDWKLEWRGDEFDGKVFGVKGWELGE
jgi:SCF-associated factor 1